MSDITPADLAKFIYLVPVGATIPAGTEFATLVREGIYRLTLDYDHEQASESFPRWTAELLPAPEPSLADRARSLATVVVKSSNLERLTLIVAEKVEDGR